MRELRMTRMMNKKLSCNANRSLVTSSIVRYTTRLYVKLNSPAPCMDSDRVINFMYTTGRLGSDHMTGRVGCRKE